MIDINAVSNSNLFLIWCLREKWVGLKMQLIFGMHFYFSSELGVNPTDDLAQVGLEWNLEMLSVR